MIGLFVVCGEPPVVLNGQLVTDLDFPVDVGTVVEYQCNDQFSLLNGSVSFSSTCQLGGTWSWVTNCYSKLPCLMKAVDCDSLPSQYIV